jgi:NADH-quinone oxidoreductase subunit N
MNIFVKIGLIGFHQWIPDVYDGTTSLGFICLSIFSKITGLFLLFRFSNLFNSLFIYSNWILFLFFVAILGLFVSLLHNLYQMKIRKFFAYSSIAQISYILFCLVLNNFEGFLLGVFFSIFYVLSLVTILSLLSLIFFFDKGSNIKHIRELSSVFQSNNCLALLIFIIFLNFIGLPPFINFFFKFLILGFVSVYDFWLLFFLAVIFMLLSIQSMFYYLRFIRFFIVESLLVSKRFLKNIDEKKANIIFFMSTINFWFLFYSDIIMIEIFNLMVF